MSSAIQAYKLLKAGHYKQAFEITTKLFDTYRPTPRNISLLNRLATKSIIGFSCKHVHGDFIKTQIPSEAKLVYSNVIYDDICEIKDDCIRAHISRNNRNLVLDEIIKIGKAVPQIDENVLKKVRSLLYESLLNIRAYGLGGLIELYSTPSSLYGVIMDVGKGWKDFPSSLQISRESHIDKDNVMLSSSPICGFTKLGTYVMAYLTNKMIVRSSGFYWITNSPKETDEKFPLIPTTEYIDKLAPSIGTCIIAEWDLTK